MKSIRSEGFTLIRTSRSKGFTLIELLVVIAIIGLLASIILASLNTAQQKGRDARRLEDLKEIGNAIAVASTGSGAATPFTCTSQYIDSCTGISGLTSYKDPGVGDANVCTAGGAGSGTECGYTIGQTGVASLGTPTTNAYQICAYLESGSGSYSKGNISLTATSTGSVVSGCN